MTTSADQARERLLVEGREDYAAGRRERARRLFDDLLVQATSGRDLREQAAARFFLGALAWDRGNRLEARTHLEVYKTLEQWFAAPWSLCGREMRRFYDGL